MRLNSKLNFCESSNRGGVIKPIVNIFTETAGLKIKCSHKKGTQLSMRKISVRDVYLVKLLKECNEPVAVFEFRIFEDRKPPHELFKAVFVAEKIPNPE